MKTFDFTVETLGKCNVPSPLTQLSEKFGDHVANFVFDNDYVRYNVDIYHDDPSDGKDSFDVNLIQKAGPRKMLYFNPAHGFLFPCGIGDSPCKRWNMYMWWFVSGFERRYSCSSSLSLQQVWGSADIWNSLWI